MRGTRPLTTEEIDLIKAYFDLRIGDPVEDRFDLLCRNKTLFFVGLYTGLRISELLSIRVGDVWRYGKSTSDFYLERKNTKGKKHGRSIPLNEACREIISDYFLRYPERASNPQGPLFFSRKTVRAITRRQAEHIYETMFSVLEDETEGELFGGKLSTHSTRKTFSKECYAGLNRNIVDLSYCLGHRNVSSTQSYIGASEEKAIDVLNGLRF